MIRAVVSIAVIMGIVVFWYFILDGEIEQFLRNKFDRLGWKRNFGYYILEFLVWYFVIEIFSCETYRLLHDMFPYLYNLTEKMH